jgi:D-glycero-alpha-D-manno-heptose-7-phosphate kinase
MRELSASAPVRIDFGGGWTDVPPYSDEEGGFVCNAAIARYTIVRLRSGARSSEGPLDDGAGAFARAALRRYGVDDVRIDVASDFPVGAGLGGSSAAGVAITGALAAWRGAPMDRQELAEASRRLEVEDLGIAGGRQDHYAAAFGGVLGLAFGATTVVRRISVTEALRADLERRCIVMYTGQSRISGETITAVLRAYARRDARVVEALSRMKRLAEEMAAAIGAADVDALGTLVGEHWSHQRALHPAIPTPLIDAILAAAARSGALGGKALGASGGGCVLLIAPADGVERVRAAVASLAAPLPVRLDERGFVCELRS